MCDTSDRYGTISNAKTLRGPCTTQSVNDRYVLLKQLGDGGMGTVYLAEDQTMEGRLVALKFVSKGRILDEARAALKLVHPNIATVRDVEFRAERPYLVEDYIDGKTLEEVLKDRGAPMPEDEVIRLLKPVALALDYAHEMGVIHRDVKPGNIMLDGNGKPFVIDFGIARTSDDGRTFSGTPGFMSIEQCHGDSSTADMDVFALAATAFVCLTGRPPRVASDGSVTDDDLALGELGRAVRRWLLGGPEDRPKTCVELFPHSGATQVEDFGTVSYPDELSDGDFKLMEEFDRVVREAATEAGVRDRSLWTPGAASPRALVEKLRELSDRRRSVNRRQRVVPLFVGHCGQRFAERLLAKAGRQQQLSEVEQVLYEMICAEVSR